MSPHAPSPHAPSQTPSSHRTRARFAAVGIAALLALTACSDATEDAISADLQQLADDARAQVDAIAADAQSLTDQLGTLPAEVQTRAEDAAAAAKDGSAKAQAALEDAGATGEQATADAQSALDDASAQLASLEETLDAATPPDVIASIDALQADVDALKQKLLDAS